MIKRGFTMVELVVVVGIVAFISALLFANFPQFSKQIAINREANRLALALRKAQSYALAVREFNAAYADDPFCTMPPVRFPPYGISLATISGGGGDPRDNTTYVIFGDADCSALSADIAGYTVGFAEDIEIVKVEQGRAKAVIEGAVGFSSACPAPTGCVLTRVDAIYQRPAPTVIIKGMLSSGAYINLDYVEVTLSIQGEGIKRKVIIRNTGHVAIQ